MLMVKSEWSLDVGSWWSELLVGETSRTIRGTIIDGFGTIRKDICWWSMATIWGVRIS